MSTMQCHEAELWISCAIDGESMPAQERERLEAHLTACSSCRDARARGERLAAGLRAAFAPSVRDRERWAALAAQAAHTPLPGENGRRPAWLGAGLVMPLAGLAAAAAALVAVLPWSPPPNQTLAPAPGLVSPIPAGNVCRVYLELEAEERSPLPAVDGSPLWREELRRGLFRLPVAGPTPLDDRSEPADRGLNGFEKVDTRYVRMTSWPYQ